MSFIFPLNWKHTLIPILPEEMIDVLDAPLPYLIGVEAHLLQQDYEVTVV
jgi:DENN (AEX-3) domain